jgi:FtsX-like permease family
VLLLSAAISSTSLLLSGSTNAFLAAPGAGTNVVIVSGGGRLPETGILDLKQVETAAQIPGILASSPEVYAPAVADGRVVVVRGVNLSEFAKLQPVKFTSLVSEPLSPGSVLVGSQLAKTIRVVDGSTLELRGLLANSNASVKVVALASAGEPFDNEVIAPLSTAQSLRGLSSGQVTFVRLKVDPGTFNQTLLVQKLKEGHQGSSGGTQANPFIQQLQLAPTTSLISIFPPAGAAPSLAVTLGRGLGLVQAVFESLDVVVLLASLLAVYFAASYWLRSVRPTSESLSALGMGRGRLVSWLLLVTFPASVVVGLFGYLLAYWAVLSISSAGSLQFLFEPLIISADPASIALASLGPATAVAAAILVSTTKGRDSG